MSQGSSISDTGDYLSFCRRAAADMDSFRVFRSQKPCREIVDTLRAAQGWEHLLKAVALRPEFIRLMPKFRANDSIGSPKTALYPVGTFSPTTLRYVHVAADLLARFSTLDGLRIVEIGGGYGGQCSILSRVAKFGSYTIFDLDDALALARRYLDALAVPNVQMVSAFAAKDLESDLVISNYAVSEVNRRGQDDYIQGVLRRAKRGYLILNRISAGWGVDSYTPEEFAEKLADRKPTLVRGALARRDRRKGNDLLTWSVP